jgi:hypothetical protein
MGELDLPRHDDTILGFELNDDQSLSIHVDHYGEKRVCTIQSFLKPMVWAEGIALPVIVSKVVTKEEELADFDDSQAFLKVAQEYAHGNWLAYIECSYGGSIGIIGG